MASPSSSADGKDDAAQVDGVKQIAPEMYPSGDAGGRGVQAAEPKNAPTGDGKEKGEEHSYTGCFSRYRTDEGQEGISFFMGSCTFVAALGWAFLGANEESLQQHFFSRAAILSIDAEEGGEKDVWVELGTKLKIKDRWYAFAYCCEDVDRKVRYIYIYRSMI